MYLKKVEIQGFKSFAEKTDVEFNNRITAIVGPNGSGKSNIADAIRWVLGEQSVKNLRGNRMEDIIFSGTEKRKALGYSEVTISFDNSSGKIPIDYSEVAVTRRMFRSGESEYYINKNSCRLKDIRELFMDTGVGKEGYSIIGQGKIDEILSNRPEDRRNIFEEAAGIVKFKNRKQEALRKLDRTQANLTRIGDLLYEIKGQKESLQVEASKAKEFQNIYGQLRKLDSSLSVYEINRLKSKLCEVEVKKSLLIDEKRIIDGDGLQTEEKFTTLKSRIEELELVIEEKRNLKMENIQEYERSKNRVVILAERENHLNKEIIRIEKELKNNKEFLQSGDLRMGFSMSEIVKLEEEYENFKETLSNKSIERDNVNNKLRELEDRITANRSNFMEVYSQLLDKKSEENTVHSFKESINTRMETIIAEKDMITDRIESLKTSLKNKLEEKDIKSNQLIKLENKAVHIETSNEKLLEDLDSMKRKVQKLHFDLESSISIQKLYNNMEKEYEGYYNSVKSVIKAVKSDKLLAEGFIGIVADLFTVDKKYVKAIEVALGSSIQNIVVQNDVNAKKLIDYLKSNRKGRATFLPLNTVSGWELTIAENEKKQFNLIGVASNLLKTNPIYSNVFKNLLGRTIISESIEDALLYSKNKGFKTRIITLDGDVVNPGGSLTGGDVTNKSISILNRKQILIELQEKINILESNIESSEKIENNMSNEVNTLKENHHNILNELAKLKTLITGIEKDVDNMNYQYNMEKETLVLKNNESLSLKDELKDLEITKKQIDRDTKALSQVHIELENKVEELQVIYDKELAKKNDLDNEFTEMRIKLNSSDRTLSDSRERILENKNKIVASKELISENEKEIHQLKLEIQDNTTERTKLSEYIQKQSSIEEEESLILKEKVKEKETLMKEFYKTQDILKELTKRQSTIEQELNKLEVDQTRAEMQIENILEKLENDYEITFDEAIKFHSEVEDVRATKQIIKEIKQKIKALGNINITSIEEYEKVLERYVFLNQQLIDLNGAKENIESVVKEMEKKMRVQFRKSFQEINDRFIETFAVLFEGGKASLEIEEGNDILTSGIEIMAQPPGKKLQSLSLLSGGEKSLTAVALLFAILKTKPAPFCILDEIDASLDEANISRYTAYLNTLEDDIQFVLITHRKTTMEIADALYGVTMEEEGVSRMISLKLKDYDEIAS